MAQTIIFNGVSYSIPDTGDEDWGEGLTSFFVAISQGALQKTGGTFTLTADANFGASFGLVAAYLKSISSNISTAGLIRLARTDTLGWRNAANGGNLLLAVNGSDELTFDGIVLLTTTSIVARSQIAAGTASHVLINDGSGLMSSEAALAISRGGTGQATKSAAFDALSPMTTSGDIVYGGASGTGTRLPKGTDAQVLTLVSGIPSWENPGAVTAPTIQKFTSGSGTYTTPTSPSPLYIRVRMVGGGGGGAGSGTGSFGVPGDGGNTTFGTTLLVANGGSKGGPPNTTGLGGAGGTASLGTGPIGMAITGGSGGGSAFYSSATGQSSGAYGGNNPLGGAGYAGPAGGAGIGVGGTGTTNTGAGGGGGGMPGAVNQYSGTGGGAGGYVDAIITSPSSTYSYAIGAGGSAGTAGTGGSAGGAGASGIIIVEEYYV
jgi:hypothetical protein